MNLKRTDDPMLQPPSGGCVLKLATCSPCRRQRIAAAFGRLCVETQLKTLGVEFGEQPPSGGCVLKPALEDLETAWLSQPPSGDCVLKQLYRLIEQFVCLAAAFGRLCVET